MLGSEKQRELPAPDRLSIFSRFLLNLPSWKHLPVKDMDYMLAHHSFSKTKIARKYDRMTKVQFLTTKILFSFLS